LGGKKCPLGKHWVERHLRRAYYRADGTYVKAADVKAHCRKNPKGYKHWKKKLKNGIPHGWKNKRKNENSKPWITEERERVFEALEELPEELLVHTIKGIHRMDASETFANAGSSGGGNIVLYNDAFSIREKLASVLAHEFSHEIYRIISIEKLKKYYKATGWKLQGEDRFSPVLDRRKSGYIEKDGRRHPAEDFSNNLEHYLFNPKRLKSVTPSAYHWIKHNFSEKFKIVMKGR